MTTKVITVTEEIPISEAIQTMVDHRIRHLPVVDAENRITGIISLRYLLHDRINELVSEIRTLESYFNDAPGG
jgi:CBS-domain-containing membrane protein